MRSLRPSSVVPAGVMRILRPRRRNSCSFSSSSSSRIWRLTADCDRCSCCPALVNEPVCATARSISSCLRSTPRHPATPLFCRLRAELGNGQIRSPHALRTTIPVGVTELRLSSRTASSTAIYGDSARSSRCSRGWRPACWTSGASLRHCGSRDEEFVVTRIVGARSSFLPCSFPSLPCPRSLQAQSLPEPESLAGSSTAIDTAGQHSRRSAAAAAGRDAARNGRRRSAGSGRRSARRRMIRVSLISTPLLRETPSAPRPHRDLALRLRRHPRRGRASGRRRHHRTAAARARARPRTDRRPGSPGAGAARRHRACMEIGRGVYETARARAAGLRRAARGLRRHRPGVLGGAARRATGVQALCCPIGRPRRTRPPRPAIRPASRAARRFRAAIRP